MNISTNYCESQLWDFDFDTFGGSFLELKHNEEMRECQRKSPGLHFHNYNFNFKLNMQPNSWLHLAKLMSPTIIDQSQYDLNYSTD